MLKHTTDLVKIGSWVKGGDLTCSFTEINAPECVSGEVAGWRHRTPGFASSPGHRVTIGKPGQESGHTRAVHCRVLCSVLGLPLILNALQRSVGLSPWWCRWPSSPQDLLCNWGAQHAAAPRFRFGSLARNWSTLRQPQRGFGKLQPHSSVPALQELSEVDLAVPHLPAYLWARILFQFHPGENWRFGTDISSHSTFCTGLHPSLAVLFCSFLSHILAA